MQQKGNALLVVLPLVLTAFLFLGLSPHKLSPIFAKDGSNFGRSRSDLVSSDTSRPSESPEPSRTPKPSRSPEPRDSFNASESSEPHKTPKPSETPRVRGFDRLKDKRLEFCQNHEGEINTRLTSLGNLVAEMLGKFDAIVQRVEDYYSSKVVPSGKSVPNYAALVADIAAKKAVVLTALTNAQSDVSGFSCTSDNPKGQITQYRVDMQSVKKSLQDYRTSVKNLIVAIASVVGETESSPSPSPVSTLIPSPTPTP